MADESVSKKGEEVWSIPKGEMGSLGVKAIPGVPLGRMFKLGPSIIVLGIALGGGELIMWPRLTAQYGAGLMWLAILGVSLQWFINVELGRYTLATGESFF
ncbi:MAG: Nramp family divalent metal transporter, partial [Desulfobacterales bacterium]